MNSTNFTKQDAQSASEQIKIYFSDDEKIKSFGEILTSDAGRLVLKMLLLEELTANQISQKSGISLQLVKYHVNKMQSLGIVSVSKIGKNSKARDMKYYAADRFAIMILPQDGRKQITASLARSLKKFSKIAAVALGLVTAWAGMHLGQSMVAIREMPQRASDGITGSGLVDPRGIEETLRLARARVDVAQSGADLGSGTPLVSPDMFWVQIVVYGGIMACLSAILFWKAVRHAKNQPVRLPNKHREIDISV